MLPGVAAAAEIAAETAGTAAGVAAETAGTAAGVAAETAGTAAETAGAAAAARSGFRVSVTKAVGHRLVVQD